LRRSGKVGKVRERGPDSRGVLFGRLVAEYMRVHGLTNQDVALKVYNDEERKSSVSDVLSGRSDPRPETIARYRDALAIPQGAIENIFSVDWNKGFEKIEGDIAALARARHADQRTIDTLSDVIQTLKSQLTKQEITYEAFNEMLHEFLEQIGLGEEQRMRSMLCVPLFRAMRTRMPHAYQVCTLAQLPRATPS